MKASSTDDGTHSGGAIDVPSADVRDPDAWAFCWEHLVEVSRTFSRPIAMLEGELRVATTCGYLLCRVADTIEDHPGLEYSRRRALFHEFLDVLESGAPAEDFEDSCRQIDGTGPEWRLARNVGEVMRVFRHDLSDTARQTCIDWIGEMVRGMDIYARRHQGRNTFVQLHTLADLERYCYFVAGTVGRLLTGLFTEALGDEVEFEKRRILEGNAESFGLGLQLVNILKDQTDDLERGWSFIPSTIWQRLGKPRMELGQDDFDDAHQAIAPVFQRARTHLDKALDYVLALPGDAVPIRLFCLLPLWMAVRTLAHARGHDNMFISGEPVKISRDEVHQLIADCTQHVSDDAKLRQTYAALWEHERSQPFATQ
ncbi:MAG: phytoene/squalene synthase family protein [Myxococcota bacterium]